ncbi:MAG TPA: hypothetical protein ENI60_07570 [Candidatus Fraserbacteria bacterium]|nr:hypothetical protein [Candidatus Fraserbacteria bacterium]
MKAVKAIYEQGSIKLLEPAPPVERALVVVVFLDVGLEETLLVAYKERAKGISWGESMDAEGAQVLASIHQELAPYRLEAEEGYLSREKH